MPEVILFFSRTHRNPSKIGKDVSLVLTGRSILGADQAKHRAFNFPNRSLRDEMV